jgi:RNA polymerase-interacting CarD/CdnL/TRCF family regulator
MDLNKLKVGQKLIERGKVYRIFKIEEKKLNGETRHIVHYKPYYKSSTDSSLVCSIPAESLERTNIRRPVTKDVIEELLEFLSKRIRSKVELDTLQAKDVLKLNDIQRSSRVLRRYWIAKKKREETLTKTQRDVIQIAIKRIVEEVAVVTGTSLTKAEEKIITALG